MNRLKIGLFIFLVLLCSVTASDALDTQKANIPPIPTGQFSPSTMKTEDGKLIPVEAFFSASRCAVCHQDTYASWSQSLHRNAAREPFYRESADILLETRGIEFTRHCESCHTPIALAAGVLTKDSGKTSAPFTPLDHEGVTCTVCHSITEARLDGTGSFTLRRPALLVSEDGTPIYGNLSDEQILADIPGHKRAMMRPLLRQPEFCATCHKVTAPPDLNGYKQVPGFSAYDEWQQSGASHESIQPYYRRETRMDCRTCHMPKIESLNDRAAKDGRISSHQWLGANTAAPLFYGQNQQVELTERFLKSSVLNLDIFAVKSEASGELLAPLDRLQENRVKFEPGEELTVEIVVANRNAAHSFPPEVRDLYEAWVECEVVDQDGKTIFHSGFLKDDGTLDEGSHVYKLILLDASGKSITRHQIWLTKIKGYDNTIQAGRSDVVRYRFKLPQAMKKNPSLTINAKVNYRRFNQEYTDYVLHRQKRDFLIPIVEMAQSKVTVVAQTGKVVAEEGLSSTAQARRWNDYGIGLMEQFQYGQAAKAFLKASELDPKNSNLFVNTAIAEVKTERLAPERKQLEKASLLLAKALEVDPANLRAKFHRALVWRAEGRLREASEELSAIAKEYPRDREVNRQLGQTLYTLGDMAGARVAFERILSLDPNDADAYKQLTPIYAAEGRQSDAARANALYLQWREDPLAGKTAEHFFLKHPEWKEERANYHFHGTDSSYRPVIRGVHAAPVR